jgi:hypothetical protein
MILIFTQDSHKASKMGILGDANLAKFETLPLNKTKTIYLTSNPYY